MIRCWTFLLLCALAAPGAARAQALEDYDYEHLAFRGAGLDYGYIWPNKVVPTETYTLRMDLGYLGPGIRMVPSVGYWSSRVRASELERLADQLNRLEALRQRGVTIAAEELGVIRWSDLSLNLDGQFVWVTDLGILTYVGAGAAVHALNGEGAAIEGTFVEDLLDSITAGVAALGGIEYLAHDRFRLYAEGRYNLLNHLRYPGVRIGGALMLGSPSDAGER